MKKFMRLSVFAALAVAVAATPAAAQAAKPGANQRRQASLPQRLHGPLLQRPDGWFGRAAVPAEQRRFPVNAMPAGSWFDEWHCLAKHRQFKLWQCSSVDLQPHRGCALPISPRADDVSAAADDGSADGLRPRLSASVLWRSTRRRAGHRMPLRTWPAAFGGMPRCSSAAIKAPQDGNRGSALSSRIGFRGMHAASIWRNFMLTYIADMLVLRKK